MNKIPTLEILIGISGSGKSTYTKHKINYAVVSTDKIREELFGDPSIQDNPRKVFRIAYNRVLYNIENGKNTIFDTTNLKPRDRRRLVYYLKGNNLNFTINYTIFKRPLELCIKRAAARKINPISEDIVRKQYGKLTMPDKDELSYVDKIKEIK